ncbi:Uridine diphosphate glucose pyrophosphatase [Orchesella cincta]|uniref:Uridine diphosphate glucose pyrophosphatase NUDT14 n=1 Tax=Orchesella cincta TaxID=48709 RepID=A0A1D2M4W0_ORCCI|nr:Uridine diphosphate glucose pyrophosphatase [Orchesella cincta]
MNNGKKRYWDMLKVHESVACVLYNTSRDVLIFVKQFRPGTQLKEDFIPYCAVFVYRALSTGSTTTSIEVEGQSVDWDKVSPNLGITLELCAGIVDETLNLNEIVKKEVLEECGYEIPSENFQRVTSYRTTGISGSKQTLFYAECTDQMKISEGGGLAEEGEFIDVVEMSIPQVRNLIQDEQVTRPATLLFGITWFLMNKV